eukprot:TRINITY_DN91180_c0_g1_i1.p1 TRINITY_DN91180_c0_g1~~TRINITY_DN91180_c0_g1_i1.p1  ORF type:complete len:617 (-),score=57.64 TRINITY_DN91180_c0_g1_i1:36-1886(-)
MELSRALHTEPDLATSCYVFSKPIVWALLRRKINLFSAASPNLPEQVFEHQLYSRTYVGFATKPWSWEHFDLQHDCFPGMLALRLLSLEFNSGLKALLSRIDLSRVTALLPSDARKAPGQSHQRNESSKQRGIHPSLDRWLLLSHSLASGAPGRMVSPEAHGNAKVSPEFLQKASWFQLGMVQWSLFQLLTRVFKVYFWQQLTTRESERLQQLVPQVLEGVWAEGQALFAASVRALSKGELVEDIETSMSFSFPELRRQVDAVQAGVQAWLHRAALLAGRDAAFAGFLYLDKQHKLISALDRIFLSDTVLLRLPQAFLYFGEPRDFNELDGVASSWQAGHCRHAFQHRSGLFNSPKVATAMISVENRKIWRCAVAMRLLTSRDSWMSDVVRARGELHCSTSFLYRVKTWGERGSRPMTVVEVGASLGDCMLAAATFLPEGWLHGYAFEADPSAVKVLSQSLELNGLHVVAENRSWVQAKHAVMSDRTSQPYHAIRTHRGITIEMASTQPGQESSTSLFSQSLDDDLPNELEVIDLLHVFANGAELMILQGASRLLKAGRVRCVVATVGDKRLKEMVGPQLQPFGYRTCKIKPFESSVIAIPISAGVDPLCCPDEDS